MHLESLHLLPSPPPKWLISKSSSLLIGTITIVFSCLHTPLKSILHVAARVIWKVQILLHHSIPLLDHLQCFGFVHQPLLSPVPGRLPCLQNLHPEGVLSRRKKREFCQCLFLKIRKPQGSPLHSSLARPASHVHF